MIALERILRTDQCSRGRPPGDLRPTAKQWGVAQARTYVAKLEGGLSRVSSAVPPFTVMDALYPGLRVARCERHHLFCLPQGGAPALIVAILHERMDLMTRLGPRLS